MANLRDIKKRINSVKNTQQITKAMKMVSAAKLRRSQENITKARPYAEKMNELIKNLAARVDTSLSPLLDRPEKIKKAEILVISSDRGLCGSLNSSVLRRSEQLAVQLIKEGKEVTINAIGRKAKDYFKRRKFEIRVEHSDIYRNFSYAKAVVIVEEMIDAFTNKAFDESYVIYNRFKSIMSQVVTVDRILPLQPLETPKVEESLGEYLFEPSEAEILNVLLPKSIETHIYRAVLEAVASEHGARMTAMDSATKNATEMIAHLTLMFNRVRQAAITKELMEIVSGAEALK